MEGRSNYLVGDDPSRWRTNVPHYEEVRYRELFPGIDLAFHGSQKDLEYDFVVSPGGDPRKIAMEFSGATRLRIDDSGDLLIECGDSKFIQHRPVVYQDKDGKRTVIAGKYMMRGRDRVGFSVAPYDPGQALVIDPIFGFSTVFGGTGTDTGQAIAVDSVGNTYITGQTNSANFPVASPIETITPSYSTLAFVSKLNAAGTVLIYSTFLGGTNGNQARGIAVDAAGNAYVTGSTASADFPTTAGALLSRGPCCGNDVFVAKLNPAGSALVYSARFGGSSDDSAYGLAIDTSGNAYVAGTTSSVDFPLTSGAYGTPVVNQPKVFVSKLNPSGNALSYSSLIGGSQTNTATAITIDSGGNAYITGTTFSSDFPTTPGAYLTQLAISCCSGTSFVTKLAAAGDTLGFSTFLGATNGSTTANAIALDANGAVYVTGNTNASNFPTTAGAYRSLPIGSNNAAFVTKFKADGSQLLYSALLGGTGSNNATGIQVDSGGATVAGWTTGANFPLTSGAPDAVFTSRSTVCCYGAQNGFVTKLDSAGANLVYSTFVGGSGAESIYGLALDSNGYAYVTGNTTSPDFPTTPSAYRSFNAGQVLVSKIVSPSTCTFSVGPTSLSPGPLPSSTTLNVTTQTGCTWVALTSVPWVSITQGSSGSGTGSLVATVDENLGAQRSATLTIAGNAYSVVQSAGCQYVLSTSVKAFTSSGGSESVTAFTPQTCTFTTPFPGVTWVHINSTGGNTVYYTVDPNSSGSARSVSFTIAGQPFMITQSTTPCSFGVSPTSLSVGSDYSSVTVTVSTDLTCSWGINSNLSWLYGYSNSQKGPGLVTISAYQNSGIDRVGTITVAGQAVTVTQTGTHVSNFKPGIFRSGFYWLEDVDGNYQFNSPPDKAFAFGGIAGDIPITGDWSGNGTVKVGIYRPSNGLFILDYDGDGTFTSADKVYNLGVGTQAGDVPVVGDWNGDGRTKVGLFRQGFFWILDYNGNGVFEQGTDVTRAFGGVPGDIPVVGKWAYQYGPSQIGIFRQGFYWILDYNGDGVIDNVNQAGGDKGFAFGGMPGDVPVVGDWNGDGISKVGIFRSGFFWILDANGNYQFDGTGVGNDLAFPFGGISGDKPVVGKW
jgi:hypothetical protein